MSSSTRTSTSTASHTATVSAGDVREVMRLITSDVQAVCRAAAQAALSFDMDAALVDASILILNGIVRSVALQIYLSGTVVREYVFELSDSQAGTTGPPAGQPPLGYVPPGAKIRLSVTPDTRVSAAEREAWFARLGWTTDAAPLAYAAGTTQATYGAFRSGGLAIQRSWKVNPKYDRATS